jgi:hypothetical protein
VSRIDAIDAAAVSAAIDGASGPEILEFAATAAASAEARWRRGGSESPLSGAIRAVQRALASLPTLGASEVAGWCFPNQPLTIVPLALALSAIMQSADDAILVAANIGGDSDSVASIAGGILGARYPATVSSSWYEVVESVNGHDLLGLASELVSLRQRCSEPDPAAA